MRMTIYVPDDLAAKAKEHDDLNVSAVCQNALRADLQRREALAEIGKNMERVELSIERWNNTNYDGSVDVAFTGKQVYSDGGDAAAYITSRGRIAVWYGRDEALYDYDDFDDFTQDTDAGRYVEMIAVVAEAVGEKYATELDI